MNESNQRPIVAQKVINIITKKIDQQTIKGMEKYNVTLDKAIGQNYNWNAMALEELIDGMQYQLKQNEKLESVLNDVFYLLTLWDNYLSLIGRDIKREFLVNQMRDTISQLLTTYKGKNI